MAFIPALDTAQCIFEYSQADGSYAQNRIYVQNDSAWDHTSLTSLAEDLASVWGAGYGGQDSFAQHTAHDCELVAVKVRDMTTSTSPEVVYNPSTDNVGTDSNGSIALGLTKAITLRTGLAGIANRGRWFWVGVPSDYLSTTVFNGVTPTGLTGMVSAMQSMIFKYPSSGSLHFVVASFYHVVVRNGPPVPRDTAILTPVVSAGYHDTLIDFQRRRAPGHNRHH